MRVTRLAAALSVALLPISLAHAQDVASAAPGPSATTLDAIVVKGEKTARDLQDTTTSVAVTTSVRIEQENLQDLFQVLERTANTSSTYGQSGFTIRGIADRDGEGAPLSTIYLDGAAIPQDIVASGPNRLWDIAQVEVLRGPQSTIQGENALAGAIVMKSEDPTMDWSARGRVQYTDNDDRSLAASASGPLVEGELAFRISAEDRTDRGFVRNITRDEYEDRVDSTTVRAKLLWTPSSIPGLQARLGFTSYDHEGPYQFTYSRTDGDDPFGNRVSLSDYPNTTDTQVDIANLEIDYDLAGPWSLSLVTAWNDSDSRRSYDGDLTAEPLSIGDQRLESERLSQEVRLRFDGDRVDGLLGLYWARRNNSFQSSSLINIPTPTSTISGLLQGAGFPDYAADMISTLYASALPVVPVEYASDSPSRTRNLALFGDGEFAVNDRLSLLGGFRYDRQRFTTANTTLAEFGGTFPDPGAFAPPGDPVYMAILAINGAVADMVGAAAGSTPEHSRDFNAFLPKFGARYVINPDVSTSFTVQRGYRSGGSSHNIARNEQHAYDPEYTTNYEASLRTEWLDDALALNANLFYVDWTDKQTTAYFGLGEYDYHIVNAGRAHLYGFELEAMHRVGAGFDWYASLGYLRTRFDEFETVEGGTVADYSGQEFIYAPRWTLAIGGNWRSGNGWVANLNANHRTSVWADIGDYRHQLSSRTLVNGRFGYEALNWSAYLFANNLLDEEYVQYRNSTQPLAILGAPRTLGIGLEARW